MALSFLYIAFIRCMQLRRTRRSGANDLALEVRECLVCVLIIHRRPLEHVFAEFADHYNSHRPHRSLGQRSPVTATQASDRSTGRIARHDRLGGLIDEYRLAA